MLRRHFMTQNDDIIWDKDDIVIQYKADKHIKFFGDITELNGGPYSDITVKVKYDNYINGIGTYVITSNSNEFYTFTNLVGYINDTPFVGYIGLVVNTEGDIIYPTDDTLAVITEITILNGGINMYLFNHYSNFVKKITVKSNNFNIIPSSWCIDYSSLEEIELGEGVTDIGYYAFKQNPNLKRITLPTSIKFINSSILVGASNVEIIYLGTKDQWDNINKEERWNLNNNAIIVHCIDGDIEL